MNERVTASLAVLKVNWDKGHDYIDNFVPFVAECARLAPQPEISLPQVQALMRETFGLRIPQGALQTILRRATRQGYLTRTHGIYVRSDAAITTLNFGRTRDDALRRHNALVDRLTQFCADRYKITWSPEEASSALLAYLQDYARPVLAAAIEGHPIPPPSRHVKHAMFIVNAFSMDLYRNDPPGFAFLETIVKGSMLTNALLFSDLSGVTQRFKKVGVYFDTRFLLRALGLAGESLKTACLELIGLLYQQNVDLHVFEHTLDEMNRVLDATARAVRSLSTMRRAYGEVLEHFIDTRYSASDVEFIISRLTRLLHEMRVEIVTRPSQTNPLGLNETKMKETLQQEVGYQNDDARNHDIDSLTAIHRLRGGQVINQIEYCAAIFVTTNTALARAATRFFS